MIYQPAAGWCLLQAEELAEQTPGGIIKPATALEKERVIGAENAPSFRVLKVGEGSFGLETTDVKYPSVGDKVFVLNRPLSIVVINKHTLFVHIDSIVGSVIEESEVN
jgi:co-chaperonin GroES (HSP10)